MSSKRHDVVLEKYLDFLSEVAGELKKIEEDDSMTSDEKFDKMAVVLEKFKKGNEG